jgi:hypothetical protein
LSGIAESVSVRLRRATHGFFYVRGEWMLQPKKKETLLQVRLAAEEKAQLKLLATTQHSTMSEAAREAIRKYLQEFFTTTTLT